MDPRTLGQLIAGFGTKIMVAGVACYLVFSAVSTFAHAFHTVRAAMGVH